MENEKDMEVVIAYLEGGLTAEAKVAFEDRLKREVELKKLLADLTLLKSGIQFTAREEMRGKLKGIENEISEGENSISLWQSNWLKAAASIALLAAATWLLWPSQINPGEKLFTEHFEPYPNIIMPIIRGEQPTDSSPLAEGYQAYDLGEYAKTILLFENLDKKDEGVLLYLGNSYLANGAPEMAIPIFEKLIQEYETFDEQGKWYLSLSHLKLGHHKEAETILRPLAKEGVYKQKAENILNVLKP